MIPYSHRDTWVVFTPHSETLFEEVIMGEHTCQVQLDQIFTIGEDSRIALDVFHPKTSPLLSFSGMYQKPFIYRRDRENLR